MTSKILYSGELRTIAQHNKSQQVIITDAPTDNHGKGNAFSPTDLVATALGSCMLTIMGIKANQQNININGVRAEITKIMTSNPRRIAKILVNIFIPAEVSLTKKQRILLEKAARKCPVAKSLHSSLLQEVTFTYL